MPRQIEKKAFLFYASTLDILETLSEKRQGKVAMALIEYGLDDYNYFADFSGSLSILEPLERIIFRSVIYEISVQKRRYYNKQLIQGAINTVQNVISISDNLDTKTKDTYVDIIKVLEDRYKYAIKHDSRNVPEELSALLPDAIYKAFRRRYELKSWRDYIKEEFEKKLSDESISLSDDDKKWILDELVKDYVETGNAFQRYEELIEQCADEH